MQPDTPLETALTAYVETSGRITSTKTAAHYEALASKLESYLGEPPLILHLTDDIVGGWITRRRKQAAANTVRGEAAKLLAVWRWLARKGLAPAPDLQVPRRGDKSPRALSRGEMKRLWRAARNYPDQVAGVPGSTYWPAMLWLLWDTAERFGAVHALEWSDIDIASRTVYYRAETRKGGIADARKSFSRQTQKALRQLKRATPATPFAAVKVGTFYYHWAKLRTLAELPRDATPHAIRRSHATYLSIAGGDARASLGHSSQDITVRHYIDPSIGTSPACDKLPSPERRSLLRWLTG